MLAPKKPLFAGVYVEDKINYKDLILNIGLRFDYFDVDNLILKDPTRPETAIDFNTNKIDPKGLEKTPTFSSVSPRLGFSFPVLVLKVVPPKMFAEDLMIRDSVLS